MGEFFAHNFFVILNGMRIFLNLRSFVPIIIETRDDEKKQGVL